MQGAKSSATVLLNRINSIPALQGFYHVQMHNASIQMAIKSSSKEVFRVQCFMAITLTNQATCNVNMILFFYLNIQYNNFRDITLHTLHEKASANRKVSFGNLSCWIFVCKYKGNIFAYSIISQHPVLDYKTMKTPLNTINQNSMNLFKALNYYHPR